MSSLLIVCALPGIDEICYDVIICPIVNALNVPFACPKRHADIWFDVLENRSKASVHEQY